MYQFQLDTGATYPDALNIDDLFVEDCHSEVWEVISVTPEDGALATVVGVLPGYTSKRIGETTYWSGRGDA